MAAKKQKKEDPYKKFVQNVSGLKCFILREDEADEFFTKFLNEVGSCGEGFEYKDELLNKLFGLQSFTIKANTFAEAEVTLNVRAKSKAEALKIARTRYEGKETMLDADDISFKTVGGGNNDKYTLRDVRPKTTR